MGTRVGKAEHNNMINALNTFASNLKTKNDELFNLVYYCRNGLGDGDPAADEMYKKISECYVKFSDSISIAKRLVNALEEQLKIEEELNKDMDD